MSVVVILTIMTASIVYCEWIQVSHGKKDGTKFYIEPENIIEKNGSVYFWELQDYTQETKWGDLSYKIYKEVDCTSLRNKNLIFSYHKEPMGGGNGEIKKSVHLNWYQTVAGSTGYNVLTSVCSVVGQK